MIPAGSDVFFYLGAATPELLHVWIHVGPIGNGTKENCPIIPLKWPEPGRTKWLPAGLHEVMGMKCYSLSIGSETSGGRRHFTPAADRLMRDITERHFPDGFTIMEADGGWFDPQRGRFVREESRQVIVCAERVARLKPWCAELARALRQKELLVIELGPRLRFRFRFPLQRSRVGAGRARRNHPSSPRP